MDKVSTFFIVRASLHFISAFACLWLVRMQVKLSEKTMGTKMVTVLGISNFLTHFCSFILFWCERQIDPMKEGIPITFCILIMVVYMAIIFSVAWAATMAFVTFKAFSMENRWDLERVSKNNFLTLILPSLFLSIM